MHAMEPCLNVLHGGHLVPSLSLNSGGNVEFASTWVDHLYTLIRISLRVLGTDENAVKHAFDWLEDNQDRETSDGADRDATGTAD
jgi:hypothetical protein